ncbi:DUF6125 family protein [candidate division KSB1 bacterium]
MIDVRQLSRGDLVKLAEMYAKNWLAHDGCWFLAAEEKYGLETAIELDTKSWQRFSVAEANRIKRTFHLPPEGGLKALEEAFGYRLYAMVNIQESEWKDAHRLVFRMKECRVQAARRRKNLPDFPCKQVGFVEYGQFAKTIDARIVTKCIQCPPDPVKDDYCIWEFTLPT